MSKAREELERIEIKMDKFPNDPWTRVEIFLRATGELPTKEGDGITEEILERFCQNYEKGIIKSPTVNLGKIYDAIKQGKVKAD